MTHANTGSAAPQHSVYSRRFDTWSYGPNPGHKTLTESLSSIALSFLFFFVVETNHTLRSGTGLIRLNEKKKNNISEGSSMNHLRALDSDGTTTTTTTTTS